MLEKMKKQIEKKCKYCGKIFLTSSRVRKCCSDDCSHKYAGWVIKKNNKVFKRIYDLDDLFLQKESNEKYYYLGIMASDGNINLRNNTFNISQSGKNGKDILLYISSILKSNYKILESTPPKGNIIYSLSMRSRTIINDLISNNIVERKTFKYCIPKYILEDEKKLKNFLIGYIDGDGSIGVYKKMLIISFVCNKKMFEQLCEKNIFLNASKIKKGNIYEFRFNGINAVRFAYWLYEDISVYKSYKYEKYKNYEENMFCISKKMKYNFLREDIFKALNENPNMNCMEYARENNLNFQYVYKNREKWRRMKNELA